MPDDQCCEECRGDDFAPMTYEEIAEILDMTPSQVRDIERRALRKLRNNMAAMRMLADWRRP